VASERQNPYSFMLMVFLLCPLRAAILVSRGNGGDQNVARLFGARMQRVLAAEHRCRELARVTVEERPAAATSVVEIRPGQYCSHVALSYFLP
jgi:hypothetical protein